MNIFILQKKAAPLLLPVVLLLLFEGSFGLKKDKIHSYTSSLCLAGKEKEVWERQREVLLPGGQAPESLGQEEGESASRGERIVLHLLRLQSRAGGRLKVVSLCSDSRLMRVWTESGSTSTSRQWSMSTRSTRCRTGRSLTWWNL